MRDADVISHVKTGEMNADVSSYVPLEWCKIHAIRGFPRNSWILRYSPDGIERISTQLHGFYPILHAVLSDVTLV